MRTPITYYGGKQRLASRIVSMIPGHKIYCEPFFGGGAVFFHKTKSGLEVINDIDDRLVNFYLATQKSFPELQAKIQTTLCSENVYKYAKDVWNNRVEGSDIEKAWAIWLITNGSFAGSMHGGWKWCNGSAGSHTAIMLRNKRIEFSDKLHQRLSEVQISCRDALRVIKERDTPETFFTSILRTRAVIRGIIADTPTKTCSSCSKRFPQSGENSSFPTIGLRPSDTMFSNMHGIPKRLRLT